jgi:3-hydroxyacyl-CoA dehydrogenase
MVDELSDTDLRKDAVAYARKLAGGKHRIAERDVPPGDTVAIDKAASDARRKGKGLPAVDEAIASIKRAAEQPFVPALAAEREVFQRLRTSFEASALRYQFFSEREAARVPSLKDVEPRPVETVGVIGGGTMGAGIAVSFLDGGYPVTLIERDEAALNAGVERIRGLYDRSLKSARIDQAERDKRLARLSPTVALDALKTHDLIVEAVFEDMGVKQELFRKLDAVAKPGAILASNTSYLDLNVIATTTKRSADVVGLHFFSPANVMRLLEVVKADATAPDVLAAALKLGRRLGKIPVVAGVCDGFIGNRLYAAYRQQCEFMIEDGAWPEEVDAALEAFGFAMGPFAVGDMSGLDIAWQRRKRLAATRDPRARYVTIPDSLCEAGRLGQKTGAGYYRYPKPGVREVDPVTREIIAAASTARGITRRSFTAVEIQRRALAAFVNEAGLLLAAGIAQRASDVDVVLVNGYGFPAHKGGALFYAAHQPRAEIHKAIDEIAAATGHGFRKAQIDQVLDALKPVA